MSNRKEIELKGFLDSGAEIKAVIGETEEEANIQSHLKEVFLVLIDPIDMIEILSGKRFAKLIGGREEVIPDVSV